MYVISYENGEWYLSENEWSTKQAFQKAMKDMLQEIDTYVAEAVACTKKGTAPKKRTPYYISAHCSFSDTSFSDDILFNGKIEMKKMMDDGEGELVSTLCDTDNVDNWIEHLWSLKDVYLKSAEK